MKEIFNEKDELDIQTIEEKDNAFSVQSVGDKEWRNIQLVPLKKIECKIPHCVLIMIRTIEKHVKNKYQNKPLEFGAFLKGEMKNGILYVNEDMIMIPNQKVSSSAIDFLEDPIIGYNGVLHRHPDGCTKFSGTDDQSINQNQEFSLLYVNNEISEGIINIKLPGEGNVRIQLPLDIEIIYPVLSGNLDALINKIELKQSKSSCDIENRICSNSNQIEFPDYIPKMNHNPLFDNLEENEDDELEDGIGNIADNISDKLLDNVFECPNCGSYEKIEDWPHTCESCNSLLQETECIELADLDECEIKKNNVLKLFNRMAEQEKELLEE